MTTIGGEVTTVSPEFNSTIGQILTNTTDNSGSHASTSYFFSIGFIIIPGIITNAFALFYVIRDIKKAVFPAIILLLALCSADLVAVTFSFVRHTITRYVKETNFNTCASLSVIHSFFKLYAGVINAMMAIDRVLAICAPFYYKRKIDVSTWRIGCVVAALVTAFFSCFPVIGLGDVTSRRTIDGQTVMYCSTFSHRQEPLRKVYGFMYSVISYIILIMIVSLNVVLIVTILKLNNRIISINNIDFSCSDPSGSSSKSSPTFEIAFAKLMGCLAMVYFLCGTPYTTLMFLQQTRISVPPSIVGVIHFMSGLSYTVDPIVYILIRKTNRKCIFNMFCRCRKNEINIG